MIPVRNLKGMRRVKRRTTLRSEASCGAAGAAAVEKKGTHEKAASCTVFISDRDCPQRNGSMRLGADWRIGPRRGAIRELAGGQSTGWRAAATGDEAFRREVVGGVR